MNAVGEKNRSFRQAGVLREVDGGEAIRILRSAWLRQFATVEPAVRTASRREDEPIASKKSGVQWGGRLAFLKLR